MKKSIIVICAATWLLFLSQETAVAQGNTPSTLRPTEQQSRKDKPRRAWEIGLGGSLVNWNRVSVTGFENLPEQYLYDLRIDHLMGGANIYLARELNCWFYLDFQGTIGLAKDHVNNKNKYNHLYMGGIGLQWRLSPLFHSEYVEPYLRVGANYLYKDFRSLTTGTFKDDPTGQATWESSDVWNPNGSTKDKSSFAPLSFGAGINAWFNNSLGLGIQGDYFMPVQKELPRFAQITLRVMYRIGGKSKQPAPVIEYRTIEKPVEVEKIVERIVEKEVHVPADLQICEIFSNVNFEFDKYTLTAESEAVLDHAAQLLKQYTGQHFLITGFTDARGNSVYNLTLSQNRARTVVEALEKRGVPTYMLKSRGVGKRAVSMPADETDVVRMGDRKVTIERITNLEYWDKLPK